MKTVKLLKGALGRYEFWEDGKFDASIDNSGEYVRAEDAEAMMQVLREFVAWNRKYPSDRVYHDLIIINQIAKELDAINEKAMDAIAKAETPQSGVREV